MSVPKPLRGEIWMIDLDPKKGREQKGVQIDHPDLEIGRAHV